MAKLTDIIGKPLSGEWGNDDETGDGIPVLRTTNFTNEGVVNYNDVVTRIITKKNIEEKYLRKGDIIIEKSGGSDKFPVGRVIYFDGEENTYLFNNFTGLLRVKNQDVWYPKYVFYSLFSNYKRGGTRAFENKTTGLHNLKIDDYVFRYEVSEIARNEQVSICEKLDKLFYVIKLRKQELQLLDNLIKARFVEMFGECNNYELLGKADIFISDGNYSSKYPTADEFVTEGIPFIRASNMIDNTITDDEMYYISEEKHAELLKGHVKPNDVLIATRGAGIGKIAVVPEKHNDSNINAQIVLLRCNKDIYNPLYLSWYMKLQETQIKIQGLISGSAQPQLPIKRLIQLTLLKPEIEMQNEFADFVHQVDKSKFIDIINQLKKLLSLKRGMYYGN